MVQTGIDRLFTDKIKLIENKNIAVLACPSSVNKNYEHILYLIKNNKKVKLKAIFSPQHGYKGDKQANMIESENLIDPITNKPVFSLYSKTRAPNEKMMSLFDTLIVDLQDIGTRVYTFIYTMYYAMKAAKLFDKEIIILDRPNPIGSINIEGNILEEEFKSFVGLYPMPMRHGMTIGEIALLFNEDIKAKLYIIKMKNYQRTMLFEDTKLPWIAPSPNIPTPLSALVYPGTVLFEASNISEGRGTCLPFQLIGAPFINQYELKEEIDSIKLPAIYLRPTYFQPSFDKFKGKLCNGLEIHITDKDKFKPYLTGLALIKTIKNMYSKEFRWIEPPYEYEYKKLPIDIIIASKKIRKSLDKISNIKYIEQTWKKELEDFEKKREQYLIY